MTKNELKIGDLFVVYPGFGSNYIYYVGDHVIDYSRNMSFGFKELNGKLLFKKVII